VMGLNAVSEYRMIDILTYLFSILSSSPTVIGIVRG